MQRIAILSATGLGDALLMMIAAHQLALHGHEVTLYHDGHSYFSPLFNSPVKFDLYPSKLKETLQSYDTVILENDHSERSCIIHKMRPALKNLTILCHKPSPFYRDSDYLFDPSLTFVANLLIAMKERYPEINWTTNNGLIEFGNRKKHPKRVVIHPSSNDPLRNWSLSKFIRLARRLRSMGFEPAFTLSTKEALNFLEIEMQGFPLFSFRSLIDLAQFYAESGYFVGNDSGPGHLASNLNLPTLTISGNAKHARKWRPGWTINQLVTPCIPLPNFKGMGLPLRDHHWQKALSVGSVARAFKQLTRMQGS